VRFDPDHDAKRRIQDRAEWKFIRARRSLPRMCSRIARHTNTCTVSIRYAAAPSAWLSAGRLRRTDARQCAREQSYECVGTTLRSSAGAEVQARRSAGDGATRYRLRCSDGPGGVNPRRSMRHDKACYHLVVVRRVAGVRRMTRAGMMTVVSPCRHRASSSLMSWNMRGLRSPLTRSTGVVILPSSAHVTGGRYLLRLASFSPQLERVRQHVGTDACWSLLNAPRPAPHRRTTGSRRRSLRAQMRRAPDRDCTYRKHAARIARLGGGHREKIGGSASTSERTSWDGPSQLQRRVRSVGRPDDVRRSDIEREQQRREILGMQLGRVRLVVVYLRIGRMIAAAVYRTR